MDQHCSGNTGEGADGTFRHTVVVVSGRAYKELDLAEVVELLSEFSAGECAALISDVTLGTDTVI